MRVLTVRQPWAWAIIHGGKDVENRSRNIAGEYRGPVAIHAGLVADSPADPAWLTAPLPDGPMDRADRLGARGCILGVVDLVDVHCRTKDLRLRRECSPWADRDPEMWHLKLANPRPLADPIPFRGGLGLRRLPDNIEQQIVETLGIGDQS